jgi:ElaB/YqjD/DUF883 family membrane-anchored ribosome-binding protein
MDNVRHDLQALRTDVVTLTQEIPSMLSEARDDSLRAARERVDRMKESIDVSLSQLGKRGRDAAQAMNDATDTLGETFHAHPIATIAVAIGLGYALGVAHRR